MFKGFYDENIMAHGTAVRSLNSTRKNKGLLAVSTSSFLLSDDLWEMLAVKEGTNFAKTHAQDFLIYWDASM